MWFSSTWQKKLDKKVESQLYHAQTLLLRAEGELENAQASVDVLRKRVMRLQKLADKAEVKTETKVRANVKKALAAA